MSTTGQLDATLARFNRKSPQDAYKQVCEELKIHYQREIFNKLPSVASAWHRVRVLELDNTLLGPKGAMALLPCILVSTTLRKITLQKTGITDDFVIDLCNLLQSHPSVRAVDISNNELVSVFSASSIISLMKSNSNMVGFEVKGTHMGDNVGNIIADLGKLNQKHVATYYTDDYFKLKNIFGYLDEDGQGWVPLKSLVMNCPYPILQEQFVERIAKKKPKKRSDNTISVNTFMSLVYMNYKTEGEIAQRAEQTIEEPYVFMVANWKQVLSAAERYNEDNQIKVVLPKDLHRLRIKDLLLTNDEADQLLQRAISIQQSGDREMPGSQEIGKKTDSGTECEVLSALSLLRAVRECVVYPESIRPVYQFYEERDIMQASEALMNGSRVMNMSALLGASTASNGGANSRTLSIAGSVTDVNGPKHTWHLAPCVVSMIASFFNKTVSKLPKRKESAVDLSPREKRDLAMQKSRIPLKQLFECSFETDFETIHPRLLANHYSRYSIPIDTTLITLQEIVIMMDELYAQIAVDKIVSLDEICAMENPFEVESYAAFLAEHLLERESPEVQSEFLSL